MSLDATPSDDELRRMHAERMARSRGQLAVSRDVRARLKAQEEGWSHLLPSLEKITRPGNKSPRKNASPTEHEEQRKLFTWIDEEARPHQPEFGFIFAVPNGAYRSPSVAGKSKAEGQRPGYFDIGWDLQRGRYAGFRGELKRQHGGSLSPLQQEWQVWYERNGLYTCVVHGWEAMRDELHAYFTLSSITE